jgi:amino acid adenylation domain-containing protein
MSESFLLNRKSLDNIDQLRDKFKGLPLLKIPVENRLLTGDSIEHKSLEFFIETDLCEDLKSLAKKEGVNLETLFTAAFKVLLYHYSGQEDVFLALVFPQIKQQDGLGVLNISNRFRAIRSRFNGNISFVALLKQLKSTIPCPSDEGYLTFNNLEEFLFNMKAEIDVFQSLFMFLEYQVTQAETAAVTTNDILEQLSEQFKGFYIGLFLKAAEFGINATIQYNSSLFKKEFIASFKNHFINLLYAIIANPDKIIGAYQILTQAEWNQIILDFNDTVVPYPKEKTLFGIFEEQVDKTPNKTALQKGEKCLSYSELNKLSNRLAHFLINKGVVPGDNIGLLATRNFDMIIGMLGILKAGGAYVPIDPDYPIERQEYIYNQSLLKMVVADQNYPLKAIIKEADFLLINFENQVGLDEKNPALNVDSTQLAYTIYTSGSTGRPKGVMIEHHSAVNLVLWVNQQYSVGVNDRLLFITSMCFDLSVYDIFGMLAAGGTLVIAEQAEIQNVKQLQCMLIDYDITFWDSVPTTIDYLIRNLEQEQPDYEYAGLKTVFLSGDWIPVDLPDRIKKFMPQTQVISLGGATEGTVWSNFYPVEKTLKEWNSIPYGKPIYNNFFYVLNEQLQPVPFGVTGNLYIGGVGVARGYANDQEKTDSAFITDPFNPNQGGVMYRTGDLGKIWPDLNMEFIGRKDNQVKILGFRIELGEVESVLNGCALVSNAIVLAKDDQDGKKRLIGYVVPNGKFDKNAVTAYLKTKLPNYMIPAVLIGMDRFPLTSNGKIDRNSLPDVEPAAQSGEKFVAPATPTEVMLQLIWQNCIGVTNLSVDANFFELGGHSLIAVQILSRFQKLTGKSFQLAVLFKYPDIQALARFVDQNEEQSNYQSLVPIKASGYKPPLYIIHGEGLNVLNFSSLAACIDKEQPIFGLQAKGLNEVDEPLESISAIAGHYLQEIIHHNPSGPYLLSGYSFGGYVAVEMQRQMVAMGKEVKMLIMFDTNAEKTEYKDWYKLLPKKVKRNFPKLLTFVKTSFLQPIATFKGQSQILSKKIFKRESKKFYQQIKKIKDKHLIAFRNYQMLPFDKQVYLFRAKICVHYVNDTEFLGWKNYAKNGVVVMEVPGDHLSMLESPNVEKLALILQKMLDQSCNEISF